MSFHFALENGKGFINMEDGVSFLLLEVAPPPPPPMTVVAPPLDLPGKQLLLDILVIQNIVQNQNNPVNDAAFKERLDLLQCEAVGHFMATFWVIAARILAAFPLFPIASDKAGTRLANRIAQLTALVAATPVASPVLANYQQELMKVQTQLVIYLMNTKSVTGATILSTLTGTQSYPFEYVSNS